MELVHRFGRYEVRPLQRQLLVDGKEAKLGARAFDVLLTLMGRSGQLVTKHELLDAVWAGLVVEENNLVVQVGTLRKLLGAGTIATIPGRGYRFTAAPEARHEGGAADSHVNGEASVPASLPPRADPPLPLPALIGREDELISLGALTRVHRLVTVVGAGGVGKTSLARAALACDPGPWRDGVHWIELAPLQEGEQIAFRVAQSLGIELGPAAKARGSLLAALSQTEALIALDNCEHLLGDVAALVRDASERAPAVRWLATSQEPLRVPLEKVYRLDTLAVPAPGTPLPAALGYGAVALLAARAAAADRRFALTEQNVESAVDLCRQLDGLPLAIEMAAARIATLGLQGVHERLSQRLRVLSGLRTAPPRQQTLRAALDWSHALLSDVEQRVFRRLAPFVGGFTAEMAQRVGCDQGAGADALDEWAALEALSALVDKSLVQTSASDPPRYHLLESARDYARERLAKAGEYATGQQRHAWAVAMRFASARAEAENMRDAEWISLYMPERDNVRAALAWACQADEPDTLAMLLAALQQMDYFVLGPSAILEFDVPLDVLARASPALRASACVEFGWAHYMAGSRERATELSVQALDAAQMAGDKVVEYRALAQLARLYRSRPGLQDKADETRSIFQQIDAAAIPARTRFFGMYVFEMSHPTANLGNFTGLHGIAKRSGFDTLASICSILITNALLEAGRFEEVVHAAQEFLAADENRPRVRALIHSNQAHALMKLGLISGALDAAQAALRAYPNAMSWLADTLARGAIMQGRLHDAALMAGHAAGIRRERSQLPDPAEIKLIAENEARLRDDLPPAELDRLLRVGAAMSGSEVFSFAMRVAG